MTKFLLLFKLEYVKFINNVINTNKQNSLNPEKNTTVGADFIQPKNKSKHTVTSKEATKSEEKKEEKKENIRESAIQTKSEETTPRQSEVNVSSSELNSTKNDLPSKSSISYQPVIVVFDILTI